MTFETEYALQEFRKKQREVFNNEGKVYNVGLKSISEEMLILINLLEHELRFFINLNRLPKAMR